MVGEHMPLGISHLFTVAVVRSQDDIVPLLLSLLHDLSKLSIDGADRLAGCLIVAGMPDHITIGEIDHDKIVRFIHRRTYRFAYLRRGHLRLEVIGLDIRTGDQHPALSLIRGLYTAVEEEGHMGILLRLCSMQLSQPCFGDHLCKGIFRCLFGEKHPIREACIILRHRCDMQWNIVALEGIEAGIAECGCDLPHPV